MTKDLHRDVWLFKVVHLIACKLIVDYSWERQRMNPFEKKTLILQIRTNKLLDAFKLCSPYNRRRNRWRWVVRILLRHIQSPDNWFDLRSLLITQRRDTCITENSCHHLGHIWLICVTWRGQPMLSFRSQVVWLRNIHVPIPWAKIKGPFPYLYDNPLSLPRLMPKTK